jgi:outer membrane protein TolC
MHRHLRALVAATGLGAFGCATTAPPPPSAPPAGAPVAARAAPLAPRATARKPVETQIVRASAEQPGPAPAERPAPDARRDRPAYAQLETLPIDLPTVMRLTDANSPAIAFAQARAREAETRLRGAELLWVPNLTAGATYTRFDGQTQNQRGEVFGVSRSNLFASGGFGLTVDTADALYRPLIERRASTAEQLRARAASDFAELDAALAYFDLVQAYAQLEINADALARAEEMLKTATDAREAKRDRVAGDVQRASAEVYLRRAERADLEGRAGAASARLARLLLLKPSVRLVPADAAVPLTLIDANSTIDDLLNLALANRADLAANREAVAAALARVRRQQYGPLLPKVAVANQTGGFGGGRNDDLQDFSSRNALGAALVWELKGFGLGNRVETAERRAQSDQAQLAQIEYQARAVSEIVEAAQVAGARYEALKQAERAVKEASELYRIAKEGIVNVVDAKNLFDALRPLQAIQVLAQARTAHLAAVLDYNRAQYRLFALIGYAPAAATAR